MGPFGHDERCTSAFLAIARCAPLLPENGGSATTWRTPSAGPATSACRVRMGGVTKTRDGAGRGGRGPGVEPPLHRGQRAPAAGDAPGPLPGVPRSGRRGPGRAAAPGSTAGSRARGGSARRSEGHAFKAIRSYRSFGLAWSGTTPWRLPAVAAVQRSARSAPASGRSPTGALAQRVRLAGARAQGSGRRRSGGRQSATRLAVTTTVRPPGGAVRTRPRPTPSTAYEIRLTTAGRADHRMWRVTRLAAICSTSIWRSTGVKALLLVGVRHGRRHSATPARTRSTAGRRVGKRASLRICVGRRASRRLLEGPRTGDGSLPGRWRRPRAGGCDCWRRTCSGSRASRCVRRLARLRAEDRLDPRIQMTSSPAPGTATHARPGRWRWRPSGLAGDEVARERVGRVRRWRRAAARGGRSQDGSARRSAAPGTARTRWPGSGGWK